MKSNILIFSLLILGTYSCSKSDNNNGGEGEGNTVTPPSTTINQVTDVDGNKYDTIQIGSQTWLQQNLKTTHYQTGAPIASLSNVSQWSNDNSGAFCYYNNDSTNKSTYGCLYNWYAVTNPALLCPQGWHIPSDSEWMVLIQ